jgi:hypothetical protein
MLKSSTIPEHPPLAAALAKISAILEKVRRHLPRIEVIRVVCIIESDVLLVSKRRGCSYGSGLGGPNHRTRTRRATLIGCADSEVMPADPRAA